MRTSYITRSSIPSSWSSLPREGIENLQPGRMVQVLLPVQPVTMSWQPQAQATTLLLTTWKELAKVMWPPFVVALKPAAQKTAKAAAHDGYLGEWPQTDCSCFPKTICPHDPL